VTKGSGLVLLVLCTGQFLMTLDSSVMNVSIAYVAEDLGTTVTGVQTAITFYTLVMATLMITGGKIGALIGRRRTYMIGCVVYATGSAITALSPSLGWLIIGWSVLEGVGAALIMPATVALVATNFPPARRSAAYGLLAAAMAMAVAAGPLIGGAVTTFASWRWVFVGEVVIAIVIMVMARMIKDAPVDHRPRLDVVGVVLSIVGLGAVVYGVLRSSEWGWIRPKPDGTAILGVSPTLWLVLGGLLVMWLFVRWQARLEQRDREPLISPAMLRNGQLRGGLIMFLLQYMVQLGTFFTIPLFLTVVLGLNALQTGLRLIPLSVSLLIASALIPKLWPKASPRRVSRVGWLLLLVGVVLLVGGIDLDASAAVVAVPLLFMGAGAGALASQLGAVTVSAVPDEQSAEVGGLQNTATNLGASLGTALVGAVLIGVLTGSVIEGVMSSSEVPESVKKDAEVNMAQGVPFISDAQLETALEEAGASEAVTAEVVDINRSARIAGLKVALGVVALVCVIALFFTGMLPRRAIGHDEDDDEGGEGEGGEGDEDDDRDAIADEDDDRDAIADEDDDRDADAGAGEDEAGDDDDGAGDEGAVAERDTGA